METMNGNLIPTEVMADLQEAADNAAKGKTDGDARRSACARMDRMREENRRLFGMQNIGVDMIRQMRDGR